MNKSNTTNTAVTRCVGLTGLQDYLTVGRKSAEELAEKAGAKVRIGRRALYDLRKIDKYLDSLSDQEGGKD